MPVAVSDLDLPENRSRCLNCGHALAGGARFCSYCGQRADVGPLTFTDLARDFLHLFDVTERSPLSFAWALLKGPGKVAREYVAGHRRRYYGPFATMASAVGLTALVLRASGFRVLAQDGLQDDAGRLLEQHFNLLLLLQLPLLGLSAALFFRGERRSLPEHMALAAYALSVRASVLLLAALTAWLQSRPAPSALQAFGFWLVWYAYYGWGASQFYAGPRARLWLQGVLTAALAHALTLGTLMLLAALLGPLGVR